MHRWPRYSFVSAINAALAFFKLIIMTSDLKNVFCGYKILAQFRRFSAFDRGNFEGRRSSEVAIHKSLLSFNELFFCQVFPTRGFHANENEKQLESIDSNCFLKYAFRSSDGIKEPLPSDCLIIIIGLKL